MSFLQEDKDADRIVTGVRHIGPKTSMTFILCEALDDNRLQRPFKVSGFRLRDECNKHLILLSELYCEKILKRISANFVENGCIFHHTMQ